MKYQDSSAYYCDLIYKTIPEKISSTTGIHRKGGYKVSIQSAQIRAGKTDRIIVQL